MEDFETHPRGTGEVLRQLRAERESLEVRCAEQRSLLQESVTGLELDTLQGYRDGVRQQITQHLKGTQ